MDNTNFLVGELRPTCVWNDKDEYGIDLGCGRWLGESYYKSIGEKNFSV